MLAPGQAHQLSTDSRKTGQVVHWQEGIDRRHGGSHALRDGTWDELSGGADTLFFISDETWFKVSGPTRKGNAYLQLAHQYMAAVLNQLADAASTPEVDSALAGAEAYFSANDPTPRPNRELRRQLRGWAGTLGDYNEGLIGPGHCDSDSFALEADESNPD